ncbi:MAG: NADH-quinone oxidoreductase subunit NuoB [Proteobacteria bacterium]|nr:NADH-quinone oxidoreductase subunit NuoB [Pseudomonadota bacterium]MBU1581447.1 NADH-quinone oxidoreductase subunit NuoB [Pseudomonadota bacterium]MBU2456239.1 NADH-quinone oxidoreductase subunit NuoB [Pseudomonadota bacterium]MBU2631405.1 NADH-quinone oxidoreductase subunit NuoB [Pseudomonadota bacterium]
MFTTLKNRFEQGHRTCNYPNEKPAVFERYRGKPVIQKDVSFDMVEMCATACPQDAIDRNQKKINMGRCVFCGTCERISDGKFVKFSGDFEIATSQKEHLLTAGDLPSLAEHSKQHFKKLFGRSLQLRQVSAAGCNACEADLNVLATPFFDLARFGINFVASPRHSDGIVVTGPVSRNMKTALLQTYEAVPAPKVVIAVGSCTITGGPFSGSPEITQGLDTILPVDLFIPGCPPHPLTNLHALLTFFK